MQYSEHRTILIWASWRKTIYFPEKKREAEEEEKEEKIYTGRSSIISLDLMVSNSNDFRPLVIFLRVCVCACVYMCAVCNMA